MSGEQLTGNQTQTVKSSANNKFKNKVDINILLNKVRSEEKREKFESVIFISLISFVVLVTGIIISL
tara:strand:+ start:1381 stop:1581 length:201 start_codon:yes stop_codon:yes gene_type:complete